MSKECCGDHDETRAPSERGQTKEGPVGVEAAEPLSPWWREGALALPAASGLLWVAGLVLGWAGNDLAATISYTAGLAAGAWTFVPGAVRRLLTKKGANRLGVALLMTIAAVGAVSLGHLGEAAALAFLFSIAETLEDRAMDRAKHGLRALLALIPDTARVWRGDRAVTIPAAKVRLGDTLIIGAGERVATDGVVLEGRSWMDTSAITGESIPSEVDPGAEVLAGSVNGTGTVRLRATADPGGNSLATIVRLVEQAHAAKGERARLADRIARPLVPLVLIAAALVAAFGFVIGDPATWIDRALVVLVAASPCALAIAVPVTVISSIGSASKFGVVIKSGEAFEQLGAIKTVAFDKTGTLTRNEPRVVHTDVADGHLESRVLQIAAALEAASTHPLATAITDAAITDAAERRPIATEVYEQPGLGVSGIVDQQAVRVGSTRWIDPGGLADSATAMAEQGMSVIVVELDGHAIGTIGIRDELRPEVPDVVARLHDDGVATVMLTGDNELTAAALAEQAGIETVHAQQLPSDKAAQVAALSAGAPTAMIGDGINDAPALAGASVGIAMGATGSAAAVESADVAFTGHDLRLIPQALAHARRGRAIMTGNIALAQAIIVVLFPLALFGVLGLAAVVLVHEVAEVVVIANGLRAARTKPSARDASPPPATTLSASGAQAARVP